MEKTHSRLAAIIVSLALALGLGGCSALKLGYSTLPDLSYWWLDGYLDFGEEQVPVVRRELQRLHDWHRERELQSLSALLARMAQAAPEPVSAQQACGFAAEFRSRLQHAADMAAPSIADVALTLHGRQLQHLERKMASKNAEWRRDWLEPPPAKRLEKRYDQLLERAETIYGSLDDAQRAVLRQGLARSSFDPQRAYAERERRQQDLLATLRQAHRHRAEATVLLRGWLHRVLHSPDAQYAALQEGWLQENCRLFSALHESTSAAQRERAVRRLKAYERDLQELARQP